MGAVWYLRQLFGHNHQGGGLSGWRGVSLRLESSDGVRGMGH